MSEHLLSTDDSAANSGCSRRDFLSATLVAPVLSSQLLKSVVQSNDVSLSSPNGQVELLFRPGESGGITVQATLRDRPVIDWSPISLQVDRVDLCQNARFGRAESYRVREKYATNGSHAEAIDDCRGVRIAMTHVPTGTAYSLEARAYDHGVAFRMVVPGTGTRVPEESTEFVIPARSTVWYHDLGGHYESAHVRKDVSEVAAGQWAAPPMTFKLPDSAGYGSITESAVINYAGMALHTAGDRRFRLQLGHAHPASYPYTLRYGEDNATRLKQPAAVEGTITTPWRVLLVGADLNTLVNSDIVSNLAPPPDKRWFPAGARTSWIKPGRCLWKYLDGGGENSLATMKEFSRLAGQLGFEYNLVEGFWQRWTEAELRELIDYSRGLGVGIVLWKHSRDLRTPEARKTFFQHLANVGAKGAKIDFFDHEAREVMDLYPAMLQGAAEHQLILNFHGANKPTGEPRTWPNELTREAVSGMERRSMMAWATHNATIPFTRMLAGHLDFTGMLFTERRRETSWPHQIATAAIFNSPLLVFGAHPTSILENPAVELIKSLPSVWDETRVLPPSEVGELAVFARRRGQQWFLAIINGSTARTLDVPLSFIGRGQKQALLVRDRMDEPAAVNLERVQLRGSDSLRIELRAGGGFVGRFS